MQSRVLFTLPRLAFLAASLTLAGRAADTPSARERPLTAGPDPAEIPLPPIKTAFKKLPGVDELPVRKEMPDVLTMNDGTKVTSPRQWEKRKAEIRETLAYYSVGHMPPPPGNVKGTEINSEIVAGGKVKYRLVHLTFGPGEKLGLDIGIFTPASGGPFPAIISQSGTPPGATALPRLGPGPNQGRGQDVLLMVGPPNGSSMPAPAPVIPGANPTPAAAGAPRGGRGGFGGPVTADSVAQRSAEIFQRGYALVQFSPNDCAEDTTLRNPDGSWAFRNTRFFPAYPGYDWSILAAWAWGASRVADYLEQDPSIDRSKLIITGASRNGKSSMVAAAFDDRLMGAPVVTGGGGVGAYRFAGPRNSETLDIMERKYPNWWSANLHEFWGHREKLPFDEHWFLAACAPRPFLACEGMTDTISYPEAVRQSMLAAKPAYALFGAEDKLGVNYANHAHAFTAEDWTAILDFADRNLRGLKVDRDFNKFPTEAELDAAAAAAPAPARGPRPAPAAKK